MENKEKDIKKIQREEKKKTELKKRLQDNLKRRKNMIHEKDEKKIALLKSQDYRLMSLLVATILKKRKNKKLKLMF